MFGDSVLSVILICEIWVPVILLSIEIYIIVLISCLNHVGWRESRWGSWNYPQSLHGCWYWWTTSRYGSHINTVIWTVALKTWPFSMHLLEINNAYHLIVVITERKGAMSTSCSWSSIPTLFLWSQTHSEMKPSMLLCSWIVMFFLFIFENVFFAFLFFFSHDFKWCFVNHSTELVLIDV